MVRGVQGDDSMRQQGKLINYNCNKPANRAVTHTSAVAGLTWTPEDVVLDWLAVGALADPEVDDGHQV